MIEDLSEISRLWHELWPHILGAGHVVVATLASGHAVIYKRDSRAAVGWVGLIWLSPYVGSLLYTTFGVNRIRRKAVVLKSGSKLEGVVPAADRSVVLTLLRAAKSEHLKQLVSFGDRACGNAVTTGNQIDLYRNGDEAYPDMLNAIRQAKASVNLATYIFDNDSVGGEFAEALGEAVSRGVEVRVLIDSVGARYSVPSVIGRLKRLKVPVAKFLPTWVPWRMPYMNLRNHRKILVVDGTRAFTGGLNIREGHCIKKFPEKAIQDLHFSIRGPVVAQVQHVFMEDWYFSKKELLSGEKWFPVLHEKGQILARGVPDGPGEEQENIRWFILGALSIAKSKIQIVTPYFVPDNSLITSLNVAAMSGLEVEIILPSHNNLRFVHWASMSLMWQLLERGCKIYFSAPPFDHSKVMMVDDAWALVGSSNWDSRSLRLNFEFNIEAYDSELVTRLREIIEQKKSTAKLLTKEAVDARSLGIRLRDGVARLFSPYL